MRFIFCLIFVFGSLQAMSRAPASDIGVRTLEYIDAKRNRPVVIELWYPTKHSGPLDQATDDYWIYPNEIRNSPVTEGKFPLILLSHGQGGDRRNQSWLADVLVKKGFIVASVEHHGNSWRTYDALMSLHFWERARDISFAIDQLLQEPLLRNRILPEKIGFVGYSLGGMTGLSLAGAKAQNVKAIVKAQQANFKEIELSLVEQMDFSEAERDFSDPRIKAMALLTPATFIFPSQSLGSVKIPIALIASEDDEVLPFQEHALHLIQFLSPAKLKVFKDKISHYAFLNRVSDKGKKVLKVEYQNESLQKDRLKVHREAAQFICDFFDEYLTKKRKG